MTLRHQIIYSIFTCRQHNNAICAEPLGLSMWWTNFSLMYHTSCFLIIRSVFVNVSQRHKFPKKVIKIRQFTHCWICYVRSVHLFPCFISTLPLITTTRQSTFAPLLCRQVEKVVRKCNTIFVLTVCILQIVQSWDKKTLRYHRSLHTPLVVGSWLSPSNTVRTNKVYFVIREKISQSFI